MNSQLVCSGWHFLFCEKIISKYFSLTVVNTTNTLIFASSNHTHTSLTMTVNDIITNNSLTEKETIFVTKLGQVLDHYLGEDFTDVGVTDIAEYIGWEVPAAKGVLGSLCNKGILDTYNTREYRGGYGPSDDLISFVGQENMTR